MTPGRLKQHCHLYKKHAARPSTPARPPGSQPIIARLIATNPTQAGWQVNAAFETAIDNLTTQNKLIAGPDLYTYFLNHASEHNSDGIHPMQPAPQASSGFGRRKMDSLYNGTIVAKGGNELKQTDRPGVFQCPMQRASLKYML